MASINGEGFDGLTDVLPFIRIVMYVKAIELPE